MDRPEFTGDELLEQLRAESHLAKIDLFEDLAGLYEFESVSKRREAYAERYRRNVGVFPEQRYDLKTALERIVAGGRQPVADVIEIFRRKHQTNGSASVSDI
jgi:hypothetical protein